MLILDSPSEPAAAALAGTPSELKSKLGATCTDKDRDTIKTYYLGTHGLAQLDINIKIMLTIDLWSDPDGHNKVTLILDSLSGPAGHSIKSC